MALSLSLLGPALVAAGLCAVLLVPTALYMPQAARYQDVELRRAVATSPWQAFADETGDPIRRQAALDGMAKRVVPLIAPFAYGTFGMAYWGGNNTIEDNAGFAGTLALFLALLAFWPRRERLPGERLWLALAPLSALLLLRPPGVIELLSGIPALGHSASQHRRTTMILLFAIAVLAGSSLHRGLRSRRSALGAAAVALGLCSLVAWSYHAHPNPGHHLALAELRNLALGIQVGVVVLGAFLIWGRRRWPRLSWLLPLLIAAELIFVFGSVQRPMPTRLYFPSLPSIEYLRENLGNDRFVALRSTFRYNVPMIYGLADLRSGSPLRPAGYRSLTAELRAPADSRQFEAADSALYDLLGVRYVMTEPGVEVPQLQRVFEGGAWIYRRRDPLARIYLPRSVEPLGSRPWPQAVRDLADHRQLAIVTDGSLATTWRADDAEASTLDLLEVSSTVVTARVSLAERRFMASSIYQDGGWRVLVDGRAVETLLASGLFVGAWLPQGSSLVELVYRPPGFLLGALLSALSLAIALIWLTCGRPAPRSPG